MISRLPTRSWNFIRAGPGAEPGLEKKVKQQTIELKKLFTKISDGEMKVVNYLFIPGLLSPETERRSNMKKKHLMKFILCVMILCLPLTLNANDLLKQADVLYEKGDLAGYLEAADLYLKALEANPDDYELNWKCARAHREYGDEAQKQDVKDWKKICARFGKEGMKYAQRAIELAPDRVEGQYYYGLSVGIYADGVSILTAIAEGLKGKTQKGFEKAYELDKHYNDAGPILSLGRFWAVLPWPMKNKKKSLAHYREYQKTEHFEGNEEAYIFLAELLMDMGGKENKTEARILLEKAAKTENTYFKDWANRLLAKMGK